MWCSDGASEFAIGVLPGSYVVHFGWWETAGGAALGDEWYSNATNATLGVPVVVTAGATQVVNAELTTTPTILNVTVDVTDGGSKPAIQGCVSAYTVGGDYIGTDCTLDASVATFRTDATEVVLYAAGFEYARAGGGVGITADMWSGNSWTREGAASVHLEAGITNETAIHLLPGGTLTGRAWSTYGGTPAGADFTGGRVEIYVGDAWDYIGYAPMASDSSFDFDGVPVGVDVHLYVVGVPGGADGWIGNNLTIVRPWEMASNYRMSTESSRHITAQPNVTAPASVSGTYLKPPWFDEGEVCAELWVDPNGLWISESSTVYFAAKQCGADLESFTFADIPAGENYALAYSDHSGNFTWYNADHTWYEGTYPFGAWSGSPVTLDQRMVRLTAPGKVLTGQSATITVTTFPSSAGAVTYLARSTDGTNFEYFSRSVPLANGVAALTVTPTTGTWYAVLTPSGWSNVVYIEPEVATVATVSLSYGSAAGGMTVTLTGSGFTGATSVTFGGVAGTNVVVRSDMQITVTTPAHPVGAVDVVVVTPSGSSPAKTYTYVEAPPPGAPSGFADGVTRLFGASRYDTAIGVSQQYAPGVPAVFVATGTNFPDALSAAAAAAYVGGPLLLTTPTDLPAAVKAEIVRLNPAKIYVIGGTGAVSESVANELATIAPVTRYGGASRYDTGLQIVDGTFTSSTTAILATGRSFPDALAATGVAGSLSAPVILVDGVQSTLSSETLATLTRLGVTNVIIAGGTSVISTGIETQLSADGYIVTRYGGADRYGTTALMNTHFFPHGSTDTMFLATGTNFPDALAGAALAGRLGAPLYITTPGCAPTAIHDSVAALDPSKIAVLGGTAVVSDNAASNQVCT